MFPLLVSLGLMLFAAVVAIVPVAKPQTRAKLSAIIAVVADGIGLVPCVSVLTGHPGMTFVAPWQMPFCSFALNLDALSAFFLVPILGLSMAAAVFGVPYLRHATDEANLGAAWCSFHILVASMVTVMLAANGLLFLIAWELTVLSSFFLVVLDRDNEVNRQAGWIYLTASHLGTVFIILCFLLLERETGSLDFSAFSHAALLSPAFKGFLFLLAVLGFGTKAGFIPFHVWLPEAHPAAPSHVSALMSGVMIKTGIYGIVRILYFLGHPSPWWGWLLITIGLVSGVLGILFALSQNDIKKLLAYCSVENIGIIAMGLGLGLLGLSLGNRDVAVLGFAGGLLHVLNHAVFKGLLFLGSGAVLEQTGTRDMDRMGGLLKRMPYTGATFLVGCLSICGLPPFNGFISEFFIYFAAFAAVLNGSLSLAVPGLFIIVGLSLIGGLAASCFAKAFSIIFLGNPRQARAAEAQEVAWSMRGPMMVLASLCAVISFVAPSLLGIFERVLGVFPEFSTGPDVTSSLAQVATPLFIITASGFLFFTILGSIVMTRVGLLANRKVETSVTWDCGYAQPSVKMQYTGSSFSQPLVELFNSVLGTETQMSGVDGYFPRKGSFLSHSANIFIEKLFKPAFTRIETLSHRFSWIQNGVVQAYVFYITITLVFLLIGGLM
ncbi:MAG: hydrogenase [Candidatus Riflebacteria bacterium]|nr:hydrogenase [Candidatus Riflebacteria bacterium]